MHLSFANANIIHQVLDEEINIIYSPSNTTFDKILYSVGFNFFVFDKNYQSHSDNCRGLPESHISLYNYDLYVNNNTLNFHQSKIGQQMHVNSIIFEHKPRPETLKKEDVAILNQRLSKIPRLYFNKNYMNSWNHNDTKSVNYGIPEKIFTYAKSYEERKNDVLINRLNNESMENQIGNFLQQLGVDKYDFLESQKSSLSELSDQFNESRTFINFVDDPCIELCALSCGCNVMTGRKPDVEHNNIVTVQSVEAALKSLNSTNNAPTDEYSIREYLNENHNYNMFKITITEMINTLGKREAFLL